MNRSKLHFSHLSVFFLFLLKFGYFNDKGQSRLQGAHNRKKKSGAQKNFTFGD